MLNENAKKLVEALRSGEFKQTKYSLSNGTEHCCLGVACEVAIKNGLNLTKQTNYRDSLTAYDENTNYLPPPVANWLGFSSVRGAYLDNRGANQWLSYDNDFNGKTFEEIADIIESEPAGLFVE